MATPDTSGTPGTVMFYYAFPRMSTRSGAVLAAVAGDYNRYSAVRGVHITGVYTSPKITSPTSSRYLTLRTETERSEQWRTSRVVRIGQEEDTWIAENIADSVVLQKRTSRSVYQHHAESGGPRGATKGRVLQ